MATPISIPVLRWGEAYDSLDLIELTDHRTGDVVATVGQANAGMIRRDGKKAAASAAALRKLSAADLLAICADAGDKYLNATLDLPGGAAQSPDDYVASLSATSGLPYTLCRANMEKCHTVLAKMGDILRGLTRGLDPAVLDQIVSVHDGMPLSFSTAGSSLGVVLPSNSPGVNSIWMPALALKMPVVLKPGREEPWTPLRIIAALIAAGCPREAFSFYPTDHAGAATLMETCDRAIIFGDARTTSQYAGNPAIEIHGPGWSKILIGPDEIDNWRDHLDVLVQSVVANGGRSCINVSTIVVPRHAAEIARAIAEKVAPLEPGSPDDPAATLSAHANPAIAGAINGAIDAAIDAGGATDVTASIRNGPRLREADGATYLMPTVIHAERPDHPLATAEYMFPFACVVEQSADDFIAGLSKTLVLSAITRDRDIQRRLTESPHVDRLNIGPAPTTRVDWDQPHEGNLFEFLYTRRAIHHQESW